MKSKKGKKNFFSGKNEVFSKDGIKLKKFEVTQENFVWLLIGLGVLGFLIFLAVREITKYRAEPPYKPKACGPYSYCRARNQDDSNQYGNFNNVVEMNNYQVAVFNAWLEETNRVPNGSEYTAGRRLEHYSNNTPNGEVRPYTAGELKSLMEALEEPDTRGKLFMTIEPFTSGITDDFEKLEVRRNNKVLDYSESTSLSSEADWSLVVLDSSFGGKGCPENPCENAVDVIG